MSPLLARVIHVVRYCAECLEDPGHNEPIWIWLGRARPDNALLSSTLRAGLSRTISRLFCKGLEEVRLKANIRTYGRTFSFGNVGMVAVLNMWRSLGHIDGR